MHEEYLETIIKKGNNEDMVELAKVFDKAMDYIKESDTEKYEKLEMKMHEIVYGKVITEDMAKEWVSSMRPVAKWTMEDTNAVIKQYGLNIDPIQFYVVMNMLYSDMKNVLGSGDDEESLEKYVEATKDWLNDDDVGKDKLYDYYKYVIK